MPELWEDWCHATGRDPTDRCDAAVTLFSRQAQPSRAIVRALRSAGNSTTHDGPAWPAQLGSDPDCLNRLIAQGHIVHDHPASHWSLRLRIRRLLFAAVLLSPSGQGGLGLNRPRALDLKPADVIEAIPRVGIDEDPASCPTCAVRSWCQVLAENSAWTHASVRALGHLVPEREEHSHALVGPHGLSRDWLILSGLLPRIDRWGYVDPYASMHPSSLSVLIRTMIELVDAPPPIAEPTQPLPNRAVRCIEPDEEAQILARADELNARVAALLAEDH